MAVAELWETLKEAIVAYTGLSPATFFTAVAVALPARIGLINVGGEGQLYMGACLATAGALALPDQPAFVLLPLLVVLGFIGGGLWALVPACCERFISSTRRSRRCSSTTSPR